MYIRTHLTTSYSVFYVYLYHYLRIGGFGVDFSSSCDNVNQRLQDVSTRLLQYGVTSFCPTLVTSSSTVYKEVVDHWIAPTTVCSVTHTLHRHTHTPHMHTHKHSRPYVHMSTVVCIFREYWLWDGCTCYACVSAMSACSVFDISQILPQIQVTLNSSSGANVLGM